MKHSNLLFGALLVSTMSACFSPRPILQLEPTAGPTTWFHGRQVLTREVDSVRVSLIFEQWTDNQIVFATEVINYSSDTVLVAPETFFQEVFQTDTADMSSTGRALDPEREILEIRKAISREKAANRNAVIFDVALATASVAVAMASDTDESEGGYVGNVPFEVYFGTSDAGDELFFLNQIRYQWENQALRKTSLPPKGVLRGSVVFVDQPEAQHYTIYVPIGSRLLPFDYHKRIIQP